MPSYKLAWWPRKFEKMHIYPCTGWWESVTTSHLQWPVRFRSGINKHLGNKLTCVFVCICVWDRDRQRIYIYLFLMEGPVLYYKVFHWSVSWLNENGSYLIGPHRTSPLYICSGRSVLSVVIFFFFFFF